MDLSNMLSGVAPPVSPAVNHIQHQHASCNSTANDSGIGSHNGSPNSITGHEHRRLPSVSQLDLAVAPDGAHAHKKSTSPTSSNASDPKEVTFVHITDDGLRGRIPFRVNITPNDSVEDIISTVKNFFGIYNNGTISFEDANGNMFIPRHENFTVGGTAYVRSTSFPAGEFTPQRSTTESPIKHPYPMLPPASNQPLKPAFGAMSPPPTYRRSNSATSLSRGKGSTPTPSFPGQGPNIKMEDGADDSDAASQKSSRRGVPSADVSLDNIVEGSRRKRAKFDSSELPLFVPPQVPAQGSLSSVSPQRNGDRSSIAYSNQRTFSYTNPLPSPGGYMNGYGAQAGYPHPSGRGRRILPTPDHTTASAMSDEDVAYQLMRLGDPSNFSNQGRTSTSTLNDAWSSRNAEGSSVDENYSGEEDDLGEEQAMDIDSGEEYEDTSSFKGESDEVRADQFERRKSVSKGAPSRSKSASKPSKMEKARPTATKVKTKISSSGKTLPSPTSLPTQSRKPSIASGAGLPPLGPDEQDLSSRPRCQRCRKSKKGCDRQRPCGRCRDAGLGIEECISEDEGNGRKGRFGRYMGVPVKKDASANSAQLPANPYALSGVHPTIEDHMEHVHSGGETGKKRKR